MLVSTPCVCVLPAGHALCERDEVTPADLADEPMITVTRSVPLHHLEQAFQAARVPMRTRIETPLSIVACRHVELGLGIAVVEPFTALYCASRNLVVKPFVPEVPFVFGVIRPESQMRSIAVKELVELLRANLEALRLPAGARPRLLPFSAQA